MHNYLTIDVGGTNIKYALMTSDANILEQGEVPTPKTDMDDFINTIGSIYDKYSGQIEGIAMSAPGRIDGQKGYFYTSGAIEYIGECDMKSLLYKRCPKPFTVENDAKCAALAELWKGSLKGIGNGIVMVLGTGIGGAVIIDGKLYRGSNFTAGEISFIPTNLAKYPDPNFQYSSIVSTSGLVNKYALKKNKPKEELNGRIFFEDANNNEEDALDVLDDFCLGLANGLFSLQLVLDVQKVAIGGGISKQSLLIETLNKKLKEVWNKALPHPAVMPEVVSCKFGNDANLIGALYHYLYEVEGE